MFDSSQVSTYVLTNPAKRATTPAMLQTLGIPYDLFVNPNWDLPADHPELQTDRSNRPHVREYAVRQFRAFRGHQSILAATTTPYTLVFEDDAAIDPRWDLSIIKQQLQEAACFLRPGSPYDAVSFHVRKPSGFCRHVTRGGQLYAELVPQTQTGSGHQNFLRPVAQGYDGRYRDFTFKWHEGCLAYMVSTTGVRKWKAAGHGSGMPCDLFLANELNTLVLVESFFLHDPTNGSLISGTAIGDRNDR